MTTFASLGLAFYYSWSLTLVTLASVPITAIALARINKGIDPSIKAQSEELTDASKTACNAISAIDTVKCFNGQDVERWKHSSIIKRAAIYYLRQAKFNATMIGLTRLAILGMFVQGFWFGSHLVNTAQKNPGDILTAFWACLMAVQSYEQILPENLVLEKGRAAGATLRVMVRHMEHGRKITEMVGGTAPSKCSGEIEVCNVSFAYPSRPGHLAIKNASFFLPAGETTFIVGRSGSGKSTLGNLLLRFYDARSGDLLIDGNPIQTLDIDWLRNNVTLVQQQSVLFNESLFRNIAFGRRDHSTLRKDEVKKSIQTAMLQETINDLPMGLDTNVGSGGSSLSGGQKQRVAIARARLRDTSILILDEATSALDHVSKSRVVKSIRKWREGKTTIIITHDMSQVGDGDYAYVLEEGVIIQEGFRASLEDSKMGPFKPMSPAIINFPEITPKLGTGLRDQRLSTKHKRMSSVLVSKDDPMDVQFEATKPSMISLFSPMPGDTASRHASQQCASPLPPVAFVHNSSLNSPMPNSPIIRSPPIAQHRGRHSLQVWDSIELVSRQRSKGFANAEKEPVDTTASRQEKTLIKDESVNFRLSSTVSRLSAEVQGRKSKAARKAKTEHVAPLSKIFATLWPTRTLKIRALLILGFVFATVHAAATPVFSYLFAKLLSTFYLADTSQRSRQALVWSLSVLGVAFMDSIASFFMHYLLEVCGQDWIDYLRVESMKRILDQPRSWFEGEKNSVARLTESLDRHAEEMRNLLGRFAAFAYVAVVMSGMAVFWSLVLSWKLTLVGLASGPFVYIITRSFETVSGRWENKTSEASSQATAVYTETFSNIRTVRALTLESYFHEKYTKTVAHALKVGFKRSAYSGFFFGVSESSILFVTALIFYYGAVLASKHEYSTTDILTVFTMLLFSLSNANATVAFIPQINSSRSTATQLLRLAHLPYKTSHEHTGHIRLSTIGDINFKNTSFTYPTRPTFPVLTSLNLTLHPGTTTALVGASGSGKSTIAALLLGLHPPTSGTIKIHSLPISQIEISSLRGLISIVPQQPTLFPATIAENIAYAVGEGSPLASRESIRAAAQAAGIHTFINTLRLDYDTPIGDGGTGLSGGQAQRIAIARALVRKPQLLVLDEATSGLDEESAKGVRDTMAVLKGRGVGVLAITHDQAMMRACGEVVVLKEGRVVEKGEFGVLARKGGELTRLLGGGGE